MTEQVEAVEAAPATPALPEVSGPPKSIAEVFSEARTAVAELIAEGETDGKIATTCLDQLEDTFRPIFDSGSDKGILVAVQACSKAFETQGKFDMLKRDGGALIKVLAVLYSKQA